MSLQLPVNRKREPSSEAMSTAQGGMGLQAVDDTSTIREDPPEDQNVCMSNSIEVVDPESDDSVIDLTQDT